MDIVISEERKKDPTARLYWYEHPTDLNEATWVKHDVTTGYSMTSLSVVDIDQDGYLDLITNEQKGPDLKLLVFENDSKGKFKSNIIDTGKRMYIGARCFDFDDDGDLDIAGQSWNDFNYLHFWRNDAKIKNTK